MLNEHKKGENYSIYLLIKSAEKRMTSKSSPYIRLTLTDRSGEIQANLWDASEEDVANYVPGKVVYLNVLQDEYQSKPQLKIQEIRLANETEPSDPSLYEISSPVSKKELQSQINDLLFQITNPTWNRVVRNILNKYADKYYEYPGMGNSDPISPSTSDNVLETLIEAIEEIIGARRFILYGHSYGGYLAQAIAFHLKDQTLGVFLTCPVITADHSKRLTAVTVRAVIEISTALGVISSIPFGKDGLTVITPPEVLIWFISTVTGTESILSTELLSPVI